ncbi:ALP1-like protein isoform X1, partial [Tanacetum coccineum]
KTEKTLKFKRIQESSRKDIERAFGVLQGRWGIIRQPARAFEINALKRITYCCVMLHNMILEDEDFVVNLRDVFVDSMPDIPHEWTERCDLHVRKHKELRDSKVHNGLRDDLVEHVWNPKERLLMFQGDVLKDGLFNTVVEGCDGVFHTAYPFFIHTDSPEVQFLNELLRAVDLQFIALKDVVVAFDQPIGVIYANQELIMTKGGINLLSLTAADVEDP